MKRTVIVIVVAIATATLLGAAAVPSAGSGGAVVKTAYNKALKRTILVDARGMTLYIFMADTPGASPHSACIDDPTYHCSKDWPPLQSAGGEPVAKGAVKQARLSVFTRDDGSTQVAYAGHPVYTWHGYAGDPPDRKPGDVKGQGYIGEWYVLAPSGKPITKLPKK
ncbi:MAG TPA: hypothetical protein VFA56_03445 [Gaiellaceae bacterium]|nr:hypothetical protein [Gaiellaceae bacterium]